MNDIEISHCVVYLLELAINPFHWLVWGRLKKDSLVKINREILVTNLSYKLRHRPRSLMRNKKALSALGTQLQQFALKRSITVSDSSRQTKKAGM